MLSTTLQVLKTAAKHGCATRRLLHLTPFTCGLNEDFEAAKTRLNSLQNEPDNAIKLKIYGLFKQSTEGVCNKPKPGMMDFVGRAKWEAWNSLESLSQDEAKKQYIGVIQELAAEEGGPAEETASEETTPQYTGIKVTKANGVCTIMLNRPAKYNAITTVMYDEWRMALEDAAKDPNIRVALVTGAGNYYCSGNDLSNFMIPPDQMVELAEKFKELLRRYVACFIDFPKPLIAALNGPAVGISVTTLGLYDAVYAVENATFNTPFTNLGQTPEGCSSLTFPAMMGLTKANAMLMFNEKINAQQAYERGLVTRIIPKESFESEVNKMVQEYAKLPPESTKYAKDLIRANDRELLHKVNREECERLKERWLSEECKNAIIAFFQRSR